MTPDFSELKSLYPDFEHLPSGQQRILASALDLFASKGFASTSTGSIAKCAGVAEGLIFKHFRSKKELLLRLARPLVLEIFFPMAIQSLQKLLERQYTHLPDLLETLIKERLAFARSHHRLLRLLTQEACLHPELTEAVQERFDQLMRPMLEKQFAYFCRTGAIRPMRFETFLRLVITSTMGLVISRELLFPDANWNDESEIRETVKFLAQGLAPETVPDATA